ncbi:MAG: zinc ABC transporter substrate-binding protein [Clostridia bacterium]|nr:zinc ABC transporter substrate-binding protein [Clostridia bacterium]
MIDSLNFIFSQEFLVRGLIVGILISLSSALLGVSLVLKRFSMIGDGLSHVSFGAMAVACAANIAPLYFALPIVVVSAFLLLRMSESGKIKGDAAIALISTGALAVGIMATSVTTGMNIDIYNYMFGSILTMTDSDVIVSTVLSLIVIALFVIFYNEIFAITFDESFAKATGTKTSLYNTLIAVLTAVTIVIGMRMMGALLISALIIFPTVTSMRVCKSFRSVIICSAAISVFCFVSGILFSVKYETPTGATVVCLNIFVFAVFFVIRMINSKAFYGNKLLKRALLTITCILACSVYSVVLFAGTNAAEINSSNISVVTTAFAQYDFARNIVGDEGEVEMLLTPGEESHTYEPTPKDILKIKDCDVFIYGGGESEKWVDNILETIDSDVITVKMMEEVNLREEIHSEETHSDSHSHENHEHHESVYDEHVWTSPANAVSIVQAIYEAIVQADPENNEYYKQNTELYINELKKLDIDFYKMTSESKQKPVIIGDRFPLGYLMDRYKIEYYSAFPGCSAQTEANPVTIAELIYRVSYTQIPVVFKIDLGVGKVADIISEETGAEVRTLYSCHVISSEDFNNGEGYISLMRRNLENLAYAIK